MAAPFNRPLSKTDDAIVAYLIAQGVGDSETVFPGRRSLDKNAPCWVVESSSCKEEFSFSGRYVVRTAIRRRTIAVDDGDVGGQDAEHKTATAAMVDAAKAGELDNTKTLADAINTAATDAGVEDYTVFAVVEDSQEAGFAENCWEETINLLVTCCCSTVPAE